MSKFEFYEVYKGEFGISFENFKKLQGLLAIVDRLDGFEDDYFLLEEIQQACDDIIAKLEEDNN